MSVQKYINMLLGFTLVLLNAVDAKAYDQHQNQISPNSLFVQPLSTTTTNIIRVPQDYGNLQDAIYNSTDGNIIELASGTYLTPTNGFEILELNKNLIIRAAPGSTVTLDGRGRNRLFNIQKLPTSPQDTVIFKGITFTNGFTNLDGTGAITILKMYVTFIDCKFSNNRKVSSPGHTVGGAIASGVDSKIYIFNGLFENNSSEDGGGGIGVRESELYVHNSRFVNNRTIDINSNSVPNAAGINAGNSVLRVTNTLFQDNVSAGHGVAIWATGEWNESGMDVVVANSTFINNSVSRNYTPQAPIEGGAITIENLASLRVHNSRFTTNSAYLGGAMSIFRAKAEIYNSVFQGNRATDTVPTSGFGGAISFNPYDRPDHASLIVEDTLFQGRYGSIGTVAQFGGGIQTLEATTSQLYPVTIRRVVFNDLDVTTPQGSSRPGTGGAIGISGADLLMEDTLVVNCDAFGPSGGFGGGMAIYPTTNARINRTIFAQNYADTFGGGLFAQAAQLSVSESTFLKNQLSGNNLIYGAAIFTAPEDPRDMPIDGTVTNSVFANNVGMAIFDDDRVDGPINAVRYDNNRFFEITYNQDVYQNAITSSKTPQELNNLIVSHTGGLPSIDKSAVNNTSLANTPTIAKLIAAPFLLLPTAAAGDVNQNPPIYLGYVWNGPSATLNGIPLVNQAGIISTFSAGTYTLNVGGLIDTTHVTNAPVPAFMLSIAENTPSMLNWSLITGSYLDMAIDNDVNYIPAPSGSATLTSIIDEYSFFGFTEEGGFYSTVDENPDYKIFLPLTIR